MRALLSRLLPLSCAALLAAPVAARAAPPSGSQGEHSDDPAVTPPRLLAQVSLHFPPDAPPDAHGDVTIRVSVDTAGQVTHVEIVSGPAVFHAEAVAAGERLQFAPAQHAGVAVAATAIVYFHFAPPAPDAPPPPPPDGDDTTSGEMVVHADSVDSHDMHARVTLGEAVLEQTAAGRDLAEATSQVAGVTLSRGTASTAKPIIRGQSERRLLLLYDGVRHESQKWGPDHAPEIDPFSAGAISVIKGAAGVRYGPDAIGGVLLVTPPPLRELPGVDGKLLLTGATNGARGYGALRLDGVSSRHPALSARIEGNYSRGASAHTPDYVLGNTASEQWNLGAAVEQRVSDTTRLRLAYQHYDLRAGIFYGVSSATPEEFQSQLAAGRPASAELWTPSLAIDRPSQAVQHDRVALHGETMIGAWEVVGVYAFQRNQRQEYAQVRASVTGPQYDFTLRTHSLDVVATSPERMLGNGVSSLSSEVGAQGIFQENVYRGYALLPNYRGLGGGVFALGKAVLGWGDLSAGARYDHLSRTAYLGEDDYGRHVQQGSLDETVCDLYDGGAACPAAYSTGSATLGGLWHVVPEAVDLKLDLSSASRFPSADELYLIGTAPTFPVYALGRPDLGVETTWGASPTLGLHLSDLLTAEVSGYANLTRDFIYFAPERSADGTPLYEVTIQGAWPRYTYTPIDALFVGADGSLSLLPAARVGLDLRGALVRATDRADKSFLIGTPPDQASATVLLRPGPRDWLEAPQLYVRLDAVARQSRTDPAVDFAPAPEGYALLGAGLSAEVPLRNRPLRVGVDATNLLNTTYREYTSLLRYYADQPGRDVRLRLGTDF